MTVTYHGDYGSLTMPVQCVRDCSASGPVDDAVAYWVDRVRWDGIDADGIRATLAGSGGWAHDELADDDENRKRFLWLVAGTIAEDSDSTDEGDR
jgi:hypothetical protein